MIPAAAFIGEYYGAVDKNTGEILGFVIWVPPGEDLNSTFVYLHLTFNTTALSE